MGVGVGYLGVAWEGGNLRLVKVLDECYSVGQGACHETPRLHRPAHPVHLLSGRWPERLGHPE